MTRAYSRYRVPHPRRVFFSTGWAIFLATLLLPLFASAATHQYVRLGQSADVNTRTTPGFALMGGGSDLDDAFRFLCQHANGGDFLILRARGSADYNDYVRGLCKLNSVATLVIPDRESSNDPRVAEIIRQAEAIFIAGGDQSLYVNFWKGTPVQDAINADIAGGKPIGGTSAGLAVLGEFVYGAMKDPADGPDLSSKEVLANPFIERVTLVRDFIRIPLLQNTLTDSHFAKRDRMGRSLGFLARLMQDGWSRNLQEIAIDEKSAVLVEADGKAQIVGPGKGAYFLKPSKPPASCKVGAPLDFREVAVYHAPKGANFQIRSWTGTGGKSYVLSVERGVVRSSRPGNQIY